ncbi:Uncharacterised protein [uncultured archaeon]|nr:Uncharacterised protein [uncultured archaeon]
MWRKSNLIALCLIVFIIGIVIPPANACYNFNYMADGKLTGYGNAPSAKIVSGYWSVTVTKEGVVSFRAFYVEKNLDAIVENSPVGSYDQLWYKNTDYSDVQITGNTLVFRCHLNITKLWTKMDWTKEWVYLPAGGNPYIIIDSKGFWLDRAPFGVVQGWDILGTTNHIKIK